MSRRGQEGEAAASRQARRADRARPLGGIRVVVTRPAHQAAGLAAALEELGARTELLPLAEVALPADPEPLRRAATELGRYSWIAFTSANAVHPLLEAAGGVLPPELRIAVVGAATAEALRSYGLEPRLIATDRTGAGLAADVSAETRRDPSGTAAGAGADVSAETRGDTSGAAAAPGSDVSAETRSGPPGGGGRVGADVSAETPAGASAAGMRPVLLPQAADARPELARGLAAAGVPYEAVVAYAKRLPPEAPARGRELFPPGEPLGWVTFTSPRIARAFAELFPDFTERRATLLAASIGPTTSAALRRLGVEPAAEAAEPSDAALAAAVAGAVAAGGAAGTTSGAPPATR